MRRQSGTTYRRIAQRQSTSTHTEETAAFDSCSAYHPSPKILFLSHCVPYPPDKGERIRAYHALIRLASRGEVHLGCIARSREEEDAAASLRELCASIHVERIEPRWALVSAAVRFAAGGCLTRAYYGGTRLRRHIAALGNLDLTVAYSSAMAQYAPAAVPLVLDMVDVDSEKWAQYAGMRSPAFAYAAEARRLRRLETAYAARSSSVFFTTRHEADVFASFADHPRSIAMENGVDFDYFDPQGMDATAAARLPRLVFVGAMDYFPNADAACRFAREIFPVLRQGCEGLEFVIVGRNPTAAVRSLATLPGVVVTGAVRDVRPYIAEALAVVAPLRVARGMQNKVLEGLAMGKRVLASRQVVDTFGDAPAGLVECGSPADYLAGLQEASGGWPCESAIREAARARFTWNRNLDLLSEELAFALAGRTGGKVLA